MTDFSIEKSINGPVIGLDEVGRGPLAGPVVSCGCYFSNYDDLESEIPITDSKKHTAKQREKLFIFFKKLQKERKLQYYIGYASVEEIDTINILEAFGLSALITLLAPRPLTLNKKQKIDTSDTEKKLEEVLTSKNFTIGN